MVLLLLIWFLLNGREAAATLDVRLDISSSRSDTFGVFASVRMGDFPSKYWPQNSFLVKGFLKINPRVLGPYADLPKQQNTAIRVNHDKIFLFAFHVPPLECFITTRTVLTLSVPASIISTSPFSTVFDNVDLIHTPVLVRGFVSILIDKSAIWSLR